MTFAWLVIYIFGIDALAKNDLGAKALVDDFLLVGNHHWGVFHQSQPDSCIGLITTTLIEGKDKLSSGKVEGRFVVNLFESPLSVDFSADFSFGVFNKLETVNAEVSVGQTELKVLTTGEENNLLLLSIKISQMENSRHFPKPDPIFFVKRSDSQYSVFFPPELQTLGSRDRVAELAFADLTGLSSRQLPEGSAEICREQVQRAQTEFRAELFDIGGLMKTLGLAPDQKTIQLLQESVLHD